MRAITEGKSLGKCITSGCVYKAYGHIHFTLVMSRILISPAYDRLPLHSCGLLQFSMRTHPRAR